MEPNLTYKFLLFAKPLPGIGKVAEWLLFLLHKSWNVKPDLVVRLGNFLPIGGLSTVIQLGLLIVLKFANLSTEVATVCAVMLSVFVNFTMNRHITWKDRFSGLSTRQNYLWFLPLFVVFASTTPTVWLKMGGIPALEHLLGWPVVVSWFLFEGIGSVLNFVGADKITFGAVAWIIRRIST